MFHISHRVIPSEVKNNYLLFIAVVNDVIAEGSSFQSDTSLYQKLMSSTRQSRDYWTAKCAGEPLKNY